MIFVWLIIFYYSITSIVASFEYTQFSIHAKETYALNMCLCIVAFILSDFIFNKKERNQIVITDIIDNSRIVLTIVEVVFWISLALTYVELRTQDYSTYVSREGQAGWAQCFFQSTCCIIVYFLYKRQWLKIVVSLLMVVGMIASTGVRSLLYFVALPMMLYFLNKFLFERKNFLKSAVRIVSVAILVVVAVYVVDFLRYGEIRLPEIELTRISYDVLDGNGYPNQYFNSLLHYLTGFLTPIIGALNKLGANLPSLSLILPPSIPNLNDFYTSQYNAGEAHMPATIFHDFYMSFGYYGAIWGGIVFSYLKLLCDWFQKNGALFFAFSSLLGWHIYMFLRGAIDGASSGIAYSILISLILFFILKSRTYKKAVYEKKSY